MHQVVIRKSAQKKLNKIDKRYRTRILLAIASLGQNPYLGKRLKDNLADFYSFRLDPYRVIYQIRRQQLVIYIITIAHRQGVYKKVK
ncbi:type II toxin-antitoxin system RelE family toxin [Desulfonauticus submarinus]|jgi:mRNA interferase RelE/StbE